MITKDTSKQLCTLIKKEGDTHFYKSAECINKIKNPSINLEIGDEAIIMGSWISMYESGDEYMGDFQEILIIPLKFLKEDIMYSINYKAEIGHNLESCSVQKCLDGVRTANLLTELCDPYNRTHFEDFSLKEGFTELVCDSCDDDVNTLITDSRNHTLCPKCKSEMDKSTLNRWIRDSFL